MKYLIIFASLLVISSCSSNKPATDYISEAGIVGQWQQCGRAEYKGKMTGSGGISTYDVDGTYTKTVMDIYDDLSCSNKVDGIGVVIDGEYSIVGASALGEDIYEIDLTNWGNTGKVCYTIVRIRDNKMVFGERSSGFDCSSLSRRHRHLGKQRFEMYRK